MFRMNLNLRIQKDLHSKMWTFIFVRKGLCNAYLEMLLLLKVKFLLNSFLPHSSSAVCCSIFFIVFVQVKAITWIATILLPNLFISFLWEQTGVALGVELDDKMPQHEYFEYFGPDYTLHVAPSNMENKNSRQLLDDIRSKLLDNLSKLRHAPSVQFQERPPETEFPEVFFLYYLISN